MPAPALPAGFSVRATRRDDAEPVLALMHAADTVNMGEPDTTLDDLLSDWDRSDFDIDTGSRVVLDTEGRVVGYVGTYVESPDELAADVYAHPDVEPQAVEPLLVAVAIERARAQADEVGEKVRLLVYTVAGEPLDAVLAAEGFEVRRRFWRMVIDLADTDPTPASPPGLSIAPLDVERDVVAVHQVINDAFADHWGWHDQDLDEWRKRHLERPDADPGLWRVAHREGEVVGALMARAEPELGAGWISHIGVRTDQRGTGVAGALLRSAFAGLRERGMPRAMLGVDSENATGATRLYEGVGMRVQQELAAWGRDIASGETASSDVDAPTAPER